ncbi:MAG: AraC family transcriptional regulator ligand-binding domain-containing protein [Gammaproteobacteria bacterium]
MKHDPIQHSTISSYAHAIAGALEDKDIDPREVFKEAEVDFKSSSDPMLRLKREEITRLFEVAKAKTADPYIGIQVGRNLQPSNLHALGYGLMASSTLRDFCQRVDNYFRLASQSADFRHYEEGDVNIIEAGNITEDVCYQSQDAFVVFMLRFVRYLYQKPLDPVWVEMLRPCPDEGPQPYLDYFNCPTKFDCDIVRIAIDSSVMDEPLHGANPELALQNDEVVIRYLQELDKSDIVTWVRGLIIKNLSSGTLSKTSIASQLHMSPRNLQFKLAAQDTSYQEILDTTRRELALAYIDQRRVAITEIAYLLGFTDSANFTRAFRRWTGKSPSEFRN